MAVALAFSAAVMEPIRTASNWKQRYIQLVEVGEAFDANQPQPATVIGIPLALNDQLPSISTSAKLLMMSHIKRTAVQGVSEEEATARFEAWQLITSTETPAKRRLILLDRYHVRYIFVQKGQAAGWVAKVARRQPEHYKLIDQKGNYFLYQVQS
jgi:hypothetical protein